MSKFNYGLCGSILSCITECTYKGLAFHCEKWIAWAKRNPDDARSVCILNEAGVPDFLREDTIPDQCKEVCNGGTIDCPVGYYASRQECRSNQNNRTWQVNRRLCFNCDRIKIMKNGDKVCDKCGKIMSADEVYNCYRSTSKGILPMKAKYINDTIQKQEAEQTVETLVNCHDCLSFEQCKTKYGPHSNCANGTPIRCDTWQSKDQSKQEPETTFSTVEKTEAENKECTIAWKPEASDVPDGTGHISVVMDENPLRKQLIKIIGRVIARVGSAKPEGNLINICKRPSMFPDLDKGQTLLLRLSEFYDSIVRIENKKTKDNDFLVYSYETLIYACLHRIAQLENDNGEITNE